MEIAKKKYEVSRRLLLNNPEKVMDALRSRCTHLLLPNGIHFWPTKCGNLIRIFRGLQLYRTKYFNGND